MSGEGQAHHLLTFATGASGSGVDHSAHEHGNQQTTLLRLQSVSALIHRWDRSNVDTEPGGSYICSTASVTVAEPVSRDDVAMSEHKAVNRFHRSQSNHAKNHDALKEGRVVQENVVGLLCRCPRSTSHGVERCNSSVNLVLHTMQRGMRGRDTSP